MLGFAFAISAKAVSISSIWMAMSPIALITPATVSGAGVDTGAGTGAGTGTGAGMGTGAGDGVLQLVVISPHL